MIRQTVTPRPDWQQTVQSQGLSFYETAGKPYWNESACYLFTAAEIDALEAATYALNEMCLAAVERVLHDRGLLARFQIPPAFHPLVRESWERDEHTIYGRFDLALTTDGAIKMLEYNADTPTGLIEAAVVQWHWLQDTRNGDDRLDQFNSLHERLIEAWAALRQNAPGSDNRVYFTSLPPEQTDEDFMTVSYLRDAAAQAGWETEYIASGDIGWNERAREFRDLRERPLQHLFKLYPWEWLIGEPFGRHIPRAETRWLEPAWKMLLSNKAILTVLYDLFPHSPYLLPAAFSPNAAIGEFYVRKPMLGREGANTALVAYGEMILETTGPYVGDAVFQQYAELPDFDGNYPILGSWMVNGHAAGIGIREGDSRITTNQSRFVPHRFRQASAEE